MSNMIEIRPQPGPQEQFCASRADITFYGGGAGGGKSFALILKRLLHIDNHNYGSVIFRRTRPEITNEGGLWDESVKLYMPFRAEPNQARLSWKFTSGAKVQFAQMQHDKDRFRWQGSQICDLSFDELTHFTWKQFNYMLSRNRSTCGLAPRVDCTCNPDPDHWLAKILMDYFVSEDTGFPVAERSGKMRYFVLVDDQVVQGADRASLEKKYKKPAKSFTFIPALVTDNQILLSQNPDYLANLENLDKVQRARLLKGNWTIRDSAGMLFKRAWCEALSAAPNDVTWYRGWDLAASEPTPGSPDPDWTAGVKLGFSPSLKKFVIADVARFRNSPGRRNTQIKNIGLSDGIRCQLGIPQDPGAAGKEVKQGLSEFLAGLPVKSTPETGDKITRATLPSAQMENGNFAYVKGPWADLFWAELEAFPEGNHDDQVDALSRAFIMATQGKVFGAGAAG